MNLLTRPLTRALVPLSVILAGPAAGQPPPPKEPPLHEKTFQRREIGGNEDFTVVVRATDKVPPAMLELLARTLEVRRVGRRDRRAELGFWLEQGMAPDAERAELVVELVPLSPNVDARQFVWTWPDHFQMSRPGVLELRPDRAAVRMPPRREPPAEGDVGVVVQPLHGGTHTVTGRLMCDGAPAPYLQVAVGGFGGTSATDGTFSIAAEFSGVPGSVFVAYTGQVRLSPVAATPTAPLQIMDDWHVTRSDRIDQAPTTTGSVSAFGDVNISPTDCVLWQRGVRALTHYFGLMGTAPPAGQLQVKRWTSVNSSATAFHTPYAYLVVPSDASSLSFRSTFFHEFGHSVRHVADGAHTHWDYDNFRFAYARPHDGGQVTNRGFVFNEGWANYWEAVVTGTGVSVTPGISSLDASFIDFNEDLVGVRLMALSAPVGHAFMVKVLLDNPGAIHTLEQYERFYCSAPGTARPGFCSGGAPTRSFVPCPTGYSNDGTTCRLIHVIGKPSFGRGVGSLPDDCGPGRGYDAGLCYALCPDGYRGVGTFCWQYCPADYHDDGAVCRRDAWVFGSNNQACPWYDKCGVTLAKGCSICPAGFANDGCACRRDAHIFAKGMIGRGAGTIPIGCRAGLSLEAGLCYQPCPAGFTGIGSLCWGSCPAPFVDTGATCYRDPNLFSNDPVIPP